MYSDFNTLSQITVFQFIIGEISSRYQPCKSNSDCKSQQCMGTKLNQSMCAPFKCIKNKDCRGQIRGPRGHKCKVERTRCGKDNKCNLDWLKWSCRVYQKVENFQNNEGY